MAFAIAIEELEFVESLDGFERLGAVNKCTLQIGAAFVTLLREQDESVAADVLREQLVVLAADMTRVRDEVMGLS